MKKTIAASIVSMFLAAPGLAGAQDAGGGPIVPRSQDGFTIPGQAVERTEIQVPPAPQPVGSSNAFQPNSETDLNTPQQGERRPQGQVNIDGQTNVPGQTNLQSQPGAVQGKLGAQGAAGQGQNPEQWRMRSHNGRWWYWTTANSWLVWHNNTWQPYAQGMFSGSASTVYVQPQQSYGYSQPQPSYNYQPGYSYGYRPSYGYNNYGGQNYGYQSGPGISFGYGSPRYSTGYRGGYGADPGYGGYGNPGGRGGVGFSFRF